MIALGGLPYRRTMTADAPARDEIQIGLAELLTAPMDASSESFDRVAERLLSAHGSALLVRLAVMMRGAVMYQALRLEDDYERLISRLVDAARPVS